MSTESPKSVRFTGTGKPTLVVHHEKFQTSHPILQIDDMLPQCRFSWQKTSEDHSEHLGSNPKGAYEFDIGKKTVNPTKVNQIWRTSEKSNVCGATWEAQYEPVGADVNQTWRTSGKSNVCGASCEPPYEPVSAEVNQTWQTSENQITMLCLGNLHMNQLLPSVL